MRPGFGSRPELEVDENPQYSLSWIKIDLVLEEVADGHAHSEEEKRTWLDVLRSKEYGGDRLIDGPMLALLLLYLPNLRRLALQMPNQAP